VASQEQEADRQRKPNAIDVHVGSRVRMRRMLLGISQEKLGNLLGLTFQQVQKYEKGANRIGASRLFELAAILGVSVQYFFVDAPSIEDRPAKSRGLAEGRANDGEVTFDFLGSREAIELNRAFMSISNSTVRRSIIDLVRNMADDNR
jgi:transcriptional regulator with XRE-family HTH domain